jgi:hypothetical protein
MPKTRTFRVVAVGQGKGAGPQMETSFDKEGQYDGSPMTLALH